MPKSQRQEVFNVVLAQLLQERGVVVAPENIMYADNKRHMPDVLVFYNGLRIAIEGEVDAPKAQQKAIESATMRVEKGIAQIGIAIVYPETLREIDFIDLKNVLTTTTLKIAVVSEAKTEDFINGTIDALERILCNTFEALIQEDVVAECVVLIDGAVERFAQDIIPSQGNLERLLLILNEQHTEKDVKELSQKERAASCRIGGLIILNAMIFHDILADIYPTKVTKLQEIISKSDLDVFSDQWRYILDKINFYSIFHVALKAFEAIGKAKFGPADSFIHMAKIANNISSRRVALRHDLMGRVYHRLLADAKYLGTYYTSIPSATMLLKLALRPKDWNIQWDNLKQVQELRIADLSCGTGTLLVATADTLIDNHITISAQKGKKVQLQALYRHTVESILYGYDVLASAIHLTASTLAIRTPEVPFKKMNLFALPLGGTDDMLGSIEFLQPENIRIPFHDLFGAVEQPKQVTGKSEKMITTAPYPELDLCVMNPPFVRSVGGNLLFGSMPEKQRAKMQTKLKKLVKDANISANITAGLGAVFIAIGDLKIKPRGKLALVLPKALLSGVAWKESRALINKNYRIDFVIVSHDAQRWNFSDTTNLSEVMLIATKNKNGNGNGNHEHKTQVVNLWRNPTTTLQALSLTQQISASNPPNLVSEQGVDSIFLDKQKAGEITLYDWDKMQSDWFLPCAFAQMDLTRSAYHLLNGTLFLPGVSQKTSIALAPLSELGKLGSDRRDIHDGFVVSKSPSAFPAFWGHDAKKVLTMAQKPTQFLDALPRAKEGRSLRKTTDLWHLAGRILLAERMWLKTQRLVALNISEKVLSNVWWTFNFHEAIVHKDADKVLVLWLNSTLGLTILFATRDETRGAWVDFKKPSLLAMPVLDIRTLSDDQMATLAQLYDKLAEKELLPLPQMATDEARAEIDKAFVDVLKLPDFSILRTMLSREPVVCMKRL